MFPILIFAVSMLLSVPSNGYTATYYVAKTGSDSNSCAKAQSQSTPKLTIAQGRACLSSGDTLIIKGGTYAEAIAGGVPSGTSWSNVTTIKGAPGETVTLKPNVSQGAIISFASESYISLENMVLDGANRTSYYGIDLVESGPTTAANHIRVQDVEMQSLARMGARLFGQPNGAAGGSHQFIRVRLHDSGSSLFPDSPAEGFYVTTDNNLFDGIEVYNYGEVGGYALQIYSDPSNTKRNNIIRNSSFHHNAGGGVIILYTENTTVENSLFYNNGTGGLGVVGRNVNVVLRNNTSYGHTGSYGNGIVVNQTGSGPISLTNNIVYGNSQAGIYIDNAPSVTVSNNLASNNAGGNFVDVSRQATLSNNLFGNSFNPKFVNPGAQDFHLQAGSAAIDVGVTIDALTTDKDGTTRPQGSNSDIGAYEYRTTTLSPPAHFRLVDMNK